jgi:hypothetical protein
MCFAAGLLTCYCCCVSAAQTEIVNKQKVAA